MSWFVPAFDLWLHVTLAGLTLTGAAALAVLIIREPARRIRVIQLAFIGLLVLPALALLPGYPRIAWWPAVGEVAPLALQAKSSPAKPGAVPVTVPQRIQPPALPGGSLLAPRVDKVVSEPAPPPIDAIPLANIPAADTQSTQPVVAAPIAATPINTDPSRTTPRAVAAPREPARFTLPSLPDYRLLVVSAYLLGVALFALWWLLGRVALWRLIRTAMPAEPGIRALLDDVAANQTGRHTANDVRLLISPRAAQPCAFGWLRPTIVLPERVVKALTREQLRLALSHEWSHVARGDIAVWILAGLARLVHFHQPLVWLLRRELRISQDYLADAAAAGSSSPEDYAELLTTLSQMLRPTPLSPGLGIAPRRSELYRRVVMLVDQTRPLERAIPRRWNVAAIALGLVLVAGVATLRAEPDPGEPTSAASETRSPGQPPALAEDSYATPASPATPPPADLSVPRARARQELLDDPTDRRDVALQLVTIGRRLESLLKTRKGLQLRLSNGDHGLEDRQQLEKALAGVDNSIADTSQRFVEMQAHFDAASLKEHARAQAAAADWEPSGDKRRLLEASWAELDQLLKTRDQVFKQAAEQTGSKDRAAYEAHLSQIDAKRVEIAHRIEELLQPTPTARAAGSRPAPLSGTTATQANAQLSTAASEQHSKSEYHFLNHDSIRDSRVQLVERVLELQNQRRQLARTREHLEKLADDQSRTDEGQKIKPELERLAAQDDQIAKEHDECLAKIHEIPLIPGDRLKLEITRKGKETETLERTIPSDGNIVLASESGNIHYYVEGKILAEVGSMIREQLKQLKSITADDGIVIGYVGHDERVANGGQPADRPQSRLASRQEPAASRSAPFSGRIRPGDILGIELVGGLPVELPPTRTVEPDGNVVLGAVYGPASRVNVAGLTLIEAGETIKTRLKEVLRDPQVVVTYEGHNDGVVAEGAPAEAASTQGKLAPVAEPIILQPLDTIEVFLPLSKKQVWISESAGTRKETFGLGRPEVSGMYLLEPDGRIALPQAGGRLKLAGLTEKEAGEALRKHLAVTLFPRSALPTARVMRRGHAVFPEGKQPPVDYRIRPGDSLLMGYGQRMALNTPVDSDGNLLAEVKVPVAGMTLEEADAAIRKQLRPPVKEQPYNVITLGGWREEADPQVIDLLEVTDTTQLLRMQAEMQELKTMIRRLQAE